MPGYKYTYSISQNFQNKRVDSDRLVLEISAVPIASALLRIDTHDDACDFWFSGTLSPTERDRLRQLCAVHTGEALPPPPGGLVHLDAPETPDARPVFMPLSFEDGVFLYVTGAGDAPVPNGRGEGVRFRNGRATAGTTVVEWGFNDWVKIVGGSGFSVGGAAGDEVSFGTYAPATPVAAVTAGTGNAVLMDTGAGFNVIIPYPGGTHAVDLSAAVPVPASAGEQSLWAWTFPDFGAGQVLPQVGGGFNLYDAAVPLSRHVPHLQLLGARPFAAEFTNVMPLVILPQWRSTCTLTTAADRDVACVWEVKCVRRRTTREW